MEGGESLVTETSAVANQENDHVRYREASQQDCSRSVIVEETKRQLRLAGPLIAVSILQNSIQLISVMFNGHLGELPLSSASLATSFASVTGFDVLVSGISFIKVLKFRPCISLLFLE